MDKLLNQVKGKALAEKIADEAGVKLHECYQCGKCSAGCPMAASMDLMPRQIVQCMKLGMMTEVLKSRSIWLCASCHICADRCPHDINLPGLMEGARMEARRRNCIGVPEVEKLTEIFMGDVKAFGRNQEVVMEGLYNVTSGHLMQDMEYVPHMLVHKIVKPTIRVTAESAAVAELIDRAERLEAENANLSAEQRKGS